MESAATKDSQQSECPLGYPPCKVCGGTGAGKHYGVYTCQSCKTFFRRYLKREKPYVCPRNADCKVINSSRGNCSACRVQKCKQVGMSVEGSKIGRRTLKERNKTILEVNELQIEQNKSKTRCEILRNIVKMRMQKMLKDRPDLLPWCIASDQDSTNFGGYKECKVYMDGSDSSIFGPDQDSTQTVINADDNFLVKLIEESENSVSLPSVTDITYDINYLDFCPLSPKSLEKCFTALSEWTDQESQDVNQRSNQQQGHLTDSVIKDLVDFLIEIKVHSHLTDDEIKKKLREEYEKIQLLTSAIGPMRAMTNEEYMDFFLTTGFDIEGRAKHLMRFRSHFTPYLKRLIQFAHKIPGFRNLILKDQASLIRAAKHELQVLFINRAVDPDLEIWMVWSGSVLDINQSWMIGNMETRKKWFSLAKEARNLNLSPEEMSIVMGMSLTFTDRCSLCKPEEVSSINLNLTNYLQKMLQERYQDQASKKLCKIMDLFVNLRSLSHERDAHLKNFISNEIVRERFPNIDRIWALFNE